MICIHGPTYRYQGEKLDHPEVIYIQDHHYDPESGYALQKLLDHSVCDPKNHLLVFDHVLTQDEFAAYPHVCLPMLLAAETMEFNHENINVRWDNKTHAFNFMINKPRPNRIILLDIIDSLGLTNYRHSLCWKSDYKSINLTDYRFGDEQIMERGIANGYHLNAQTYDKILKNRVFEDTCVSLITEPVYYERETIITEKTLMAIWAGTFPIWVGGWRCADYMRMSGFDVFDDIVNHGYQYMLDPYQRCYHAIIDNLHLLQTPQDMLMVKHRLQHNLGLLKSNFFLDQVKEKAKEHPALWPIVQRFRQGCLYTDYMA